MTRPRLALLPAALLIGIFFCAFVVFSYAGLMHSAGGSPGYVPPISLRNYARFLTNTQALAVLGWTLLFSAGVTFATVALGYPLAYLAARTEIGALRNVILGILIVTFLTGAISRAYGWMILLGRHGLINDVLIYLKAIERPFALIYNDTGVFISLLHFTLPFFVLTVFGSVRKVPRRLEEAAKDLGASAIRTFFVIVVPLTAPAIINGAALAFSLSISAFVFPLLLGGGRVQLISNYIYDQLFVSFDLPYAAAVSLLFLVTAMMTMLGFHYLEKFVRRSVVRSGQ